MGRYKYPRTRHLPWSPGASRDDVIAKEVEAFSGQRVIVSEKMDGENTTLYRDHSHARSLDSRHHPSRNWVKGLHGSIAHEIPEGWRICGENLYARHSIDYEELSTYFMLFSVWDADNRCLDWDSTCEWAELLGLETVPVLWQQRHGSSPPWHLVPRCLQVPEWALGRSAVTEHRQLLEDDV